MSNDIEIVRDACDKCGRGETRTEDEINLTYNLSPMLRAAGAKPWVDYAGKPAREVGEEILAVLDRMAEDPEKWRAMNPSNGWGDYDRCLQGRLRNWAEIAASAGPNDKVQVW